MTSSSAETKKPSKSLLRSTGTVGSMTLISRILGFVRDVVTAQLFGASASADAFLVAFKIPNFLRRLFAEGAFSQAFIPVLAEYKTQKSHDEVQELVNKTATALAIVLGLLSVIAALAAPLLVMLFAPGFIKDPLKLDLASNMLRITFPYLLFISLTAFVSSILNSYGRYAVPAFTPTLLNISLIVAAWYGAPYFSDPITALAWGVFIAGIVQFLFQLPFLYRLKLSLVWSLDWQHPGVRRILQLMAPAIFSVSVGQISLLLDTILASFLQTGSVAWLYYADRLMEFPLGVFGIAVSTVMLPSLSRHHAEQSAEQFSKTIDWGLRMVLLVGVPAAIALAILAEPLLATLFQYGEFQAHDVIMAGKSLKAYALGLLAFMLVKILAPGYFARQDTKTPMKFALITLAFNMVINLSLIVPLAHVGIALGTSLAASLNALLLFLGLYRSKAYQPGLGWTQFFVRLFIANSIMVMMLWLLMGSTTAWLAWGWEQRALHLSSLTVAGIAIYFGSLFLMGMRLRHLHT